MKKKAKEKMKKVWNLQFEFNKILWMLSHAMAVFFGESDRSVNLGEKTKEESRETKEFLFDLIRGIVIILCKEAKMEDEEFQDTVCYFVLREALEIKVARLKKEEMKKAKKRSKK